jgi:spermidine synthase
MPLVLAISVLSAAVVGYEILLMRLFSVIQWHHFAYMIISLALLGYGASGTVLAFVRDWASERFATVFAAAAALFGLSAVAAFALAQRTAFNPLEVVWDPRQFLNLLVLYVLLAVPFFCAAFAIGLSYYRYGGRIGVLYRADLMGAGAGALGVVLVLFVLRPERALELLGAMGLVAAGLVGLERRRGLPLALVLFAAAALSPYLWPDRALALRLSPYKALSQALEMPGAEVVAERSSPLGMLTVVRSPTIPFRHAPGLSLMNEGQVPPQIGLFSDGDSLTAITRHQAGDDGGGRQVLRYLDFQTAALPYHLLERPRVLVLGAGGGADVLLARYHRAAAIDAIELNPQTVALVRDEFADFAGHLYDLPEVHVTVAEARSYVSAGGAAYDLIHISLLDSFAASVAGLYALNESTLYTVEAFEAYLGRLAPGGLLAITRWLKVPPRDSLKLVATAARALERRGVAEPGRRMALIRGWNTFTLVLKNGALSAAEVASVRAFAEARAFDLAHLPGLSADQANRYNLLAEPYFHAGVRALLGTEAGAFLRDYKYDVAPATDDRPYFFHFFKWRLLPELARLGAAGGPALLELGYLILVATVIQAALVGVVLIVLPLGAVRRAAAGPEAGPRLVRVLLYFGALGLAFLFVEIAFIQRFVLFLGHPLYAVAVVLAAFLVFAGIGSGLSPRLAARAGARATPLAVAVIVAVALIYILLLPALFEWLRPLPIAARIVASLALIAPLALAMGMPFPLGLSRLSEAAPHLVPWAWAVNGCASVLAAVLATLLAIEMGFAAVVVAALALYGLAAAVFTGRGFASAV